MSTNKQIPSGLSANTEKVFDEVSKLDCIKGLWLCGGTGISLQLHHRVSEDLDFEILGTRNPRPELQFNQIIQEVNRTFPGASKEILGDNHFEMNIRGNVKLSFFRPDNTVPSLTEGCHFGNIAIPTLQELLGMKLFLVTQRTVYRDYYDIYSLLENGFSFSEGMSYALKFSRHSIHTKDIISTLTTPGFFSKESKFADIFQPAYDVTSEQICNRIKDEISRFNQSPVQQEWKVLEKNGRFNYSDNNGHILLKNWVDKAEPFKNGKANVVFGDIPMTINTKGEVLSKGEKPKAALNEPRSPRHKSPN